ncbi:hypothetical protein D5S18_34175 [Nocardia panacis]|uniref:DUF4913 domain-containing protein n=1 Tax=Nocardia panacis TaxID=2340916 RepID=A0A3A4K7U9_9NOCA|nr:hypothetical protein [Nocardia panacis]RJO67950.1 hypothetical protein D5S18_34175 [Nocardia panacis]
MDDEYGGRAAEETETVASRYAWRELSLSDAVALWKELAEWADWLRHRYQLGSRVPPCWWQHEVVVEELTALMAAHTAAYSVPAEQRDLAREDMAAWHTQWLWPTIERLTRISDFSACRPTGCRYQRHRQTTLDGLRDHIDRIATRGDRATGNGS